MTRIRTGVAGMAVVGVVRVVGDRVAEGTETGLVTGDEGVEAGAGEGVEVGVAEAAGSEVMGTRAGAMQLLVGASNVSSMPSSSALHLGLKMQCR